MTSGEGPVLVDLEMLGDDDELRAAAAAAPVVEASAHGHYLATDPTRVVRVTVDRQALLVDVTIDQDWQNRLQPELFADTLFTTYLQAVHGAFLGERSATAPAAPEPAPGPDPARAEPPGSAEWEAGVRASLAEIDDVLRSVRRPAAAGGGVTEIRGPDGYLTLRVRGGSAEGITADPELLGYANPERLRADALAVFAEAGLAVEVDLDEDWD